MQTKWIIPAMVATVLTAVSCTTEVAAPTPMGPDDMIRPVDTTPRCGADLRDDLGVITRDLLYMSESDRPLEPLWWPATDVGTSDFSADQVRRLARLDPSTPVETVEFDAWIERVATAQEWMDDGQRRDAARFAAVRNWFRSTLASTVVVRSGSIEVVIHVLGLDACGNAVGFRTVSVET